MRRPVIIAAGVGVVLATTAGVLVATADEPASSGGAGGSAGRRSTATVEVRDLVERESFDGTLGYADARTIRAGLQGTLTWARSEGSRIRRGSRLYAVDGRPVYALWGRVPAWRTLDATVDDGQDVLQLERNLEAMGYEPGDVDGDWDADTTAAVERWEDERGVAEDGVVELGEVAFVAPRARVGDVKLSVGDPVGAGAEVLEATSRRREVTVQLEATRQTLVREGDEVEVELPDGSTVSGRITEVGRVAQTDPDDQDAEPYVTVLISLDDEAAGGGLDQAPVDVGIAVERAEGVLAVPVEALLALAEGGYAVERPDGSLVAVETGLFADGWVEIRGEGVSEGLRVVVPS